MFKHLCARRRLGNVRVLPPRAVQRQQVCVLTGVGVGGVRGAGAFKAAGGAVVQALLGHGAHLAHRWPAEGLGVFRLDLLPRGFKPGFKGLDVAVAVHGDAGLHLAVPEDRAAGV